MRTAVRCCLVLVFLAVPTLAQSSLNPSILPPETSWFVHWRGSAGTEPAKGVNSLLRLWNDPGFTPVREEMLGQMHGDGNKPAAVFTGDVLWKLLENPVLVGGFVAPKKASAPLGSGAANGKVAEPDYVFLIYDASGKMDLVRLLLAAPPEDASKASLVTPIRLGRVPAEKVVEPKETYYRTFVGTFFVRAQRPEVLEKVAARLEAGVAGASLVQNTDYQKARQTLGADTALEFFVRVQDWIPTEAASPADQQVQEILKNLRLDEIRSITGSLSFVGEATRVRVSVLGDTTPGGLLNLMGTGTAQFETLTLTPADAMSYNAGRFNLNALYGLMRQVVMASMKPEQASGVDLMEKMIAAQIGLPVPEALDLFTGEFASISTSDSGDPLGDMYAATIREPDSVLRVLRAVLGDRVTSESRDAGATVLTIPMPYVDPRTQAQRSRFYHIAVAPQLLIVAPRKTMIRDALLRFGQDGGAIGLAADPNFQRARGKLPGTLSGFSFSNLAKINWDKVGETVNSAQGLAGQKEGTSAAKPSWSSKIPAALLSRYLHFLAGGWWVDRTGVHYDGYIE